MEGLKVQFLDQYQSEMSSTVMTRDGSYTFENLALGTYSIQFFQPASNSCGLRLRDGSG